MITRNTIHQELSRRIFAAERGQYELPHERNIAVIAGMSAMALEFAVQPILDTSLDLAALASARRNLRDKALATATQALRLVYTLDDAIS